MPNTIRKIGYDVASFADNPLQLLTVEETAKILRCSKSSLNKWRLTGAGPRFVRLGRSVRYRPADIVNYFAEQTRSSTSESAA